MNNLSKCKWLLLLPSVFWTEVALSQQGGDTANGLRQLQEIEESRQAVPAKIDLLEDLLSAYPTQNADDLLVAKMLGRLGEYYCKSGNSVKGIELLKNAVSFDRSGTKALPDRSFLAGTYYNLGFYCNKSNLFEDFQLYMDSCISISMEYPEQKEIGIHAYEQLAVHYNSIGEYHKTIDLANNGIFMGEALNSNAYTALLYLQKAQAEMALGATEKDSSYVISADENIETAIGILRATKAKEEYISIAFAMKARLLEQKGYRESAIPLYEKAFSIDSLAENYQNAVKIKSYIGLLYDVWGYPEKALDTYRSSFDLIKKINYPAQAAMEEASTYTNMGVVYYFTEDYQKALENFQNGIDALLTANPGTSFDPMVFKNYSMSERMPLLRSLFSNIGETLLVQFHKNQIQKHDLNPALTAFRWADKAVDQMRWNQSNQQSKLVWRRQTKSMYEKAIKVCYLLNDTESAYYFFEKSRAVLLNDKLNELGAQQYLSHADQEKEKHLRVQLKSAQQKLSELQASDPAYRQYATETFDIQGDYEKFIKNLETNYPAYYQYKYDTVISSFTDLQISLKDNQQTYIGYFTGEEHIYVLTIDAGSASLSSFESDQIGEDISELLGICADRIKINQNYSRYSELSYKLYETLFKPLAVNTQRVIISPDDQFIPFELLLTERNNPTSFLLHDHAFSYTYSAGYLLKNRQDNNPAKATLLGMAPVAYQPHLQQPTLAGADLSLNTIQDNFSSAQSYVREKAAKHEFLENVPQYAIAHIYSHAEADTEGKEPTIYFYDSALKVSDLQLLGDLPTRLIVLSACNTGVGKNMKGEGVFSLARGFAAAGIPSSITSLWQIDNQSTYRITELFYKNLGQGLPLDIALQEAKLEFLRIQEKPYDLPYFWAGSILLGNSDGFVPERGYRIYSFPNLIGLIIIVFFIISSLIYRKKHRRNKPILQGF